MLECYKSSNNVWIINLCITHLLIYLTPSGIDIWSSLRKLCALLLKIENVILNSLWNFKCCEMNSHQARLLIAFSSFPPGISLFCKSNITYFWQCAQLVALIIVNYKHQNCERIHHFGFVEPNKHLVRIPHKSLHCWLCEYVPVSLVISG